MKRRKKRKSMLIVPVVSMGDIAFLLIIFFVLCSDFAKDVGQKITPAYSQDIDTLEKADTLVSIDEDEQIWVDGVEFGSADAVEDYLAEKIPSDAPERKKRVQFKVDAEIAQDVFQPVLEAIAKAGCIPEAVGEEGAPPDKKDGSD